MVRVAVEFEDNRMQVKEAIRDAAIGFLHEAAGEMVSQTARNTKVKTGQTKRSWSYVVNEESLEAVIGSPLENAIWEEFGTGEYALNNNGRKGGWVYYAGKDKDGKDQFYFTLGKKPRRPFFKAFKALKTAIIRKAERRFGEIK